MPDRDRNGRPGQQGPPPQQHPDQQQPPQRPLRVPLFDDGADEPPAYPPPPRVDPQHSTGTNAFSGPTGPSYLPGEGNQTGESTRISGPYRQQPGHTTVNTGGHAQQRPPLPPGSATEPTLARPPRPPEPPPSIPRRTQDDDRVTGVVVAADSVHAGAGSRKRRTGMGEGIDWSLVRAFRQEAANQLTNATLDREGLDDATRQEPGRKIILDLLSNHAREADFAGRGGFTPREQQHLAEAIFNSLFGLGRLQPLVDNPDLENIEIRGYDNVHLVYSDGRIEHGPPVADSDEELIDTLAFLAARSGGSERPFSPSNPDLDLRLPGGARLAASAWNTPRPLVVIRRHRLVDVDLDDLVALDMLDDGLASFLRACIRSKKSIVVSGAQGAGKTTLVRALCNEIPPMEAIGTIETEFELHLHEMGDRHPRCSPWEARPGSGEKTADGRRLGEVTLDDILYRSLRMNLSRIIVGEVRGREVIPMFKAMQAGAGSVSTTHAHSAHAAIERLVTCATEAGPQISEPWAYRQIAEHINIIVQITMRDSSNVHGQGKRERFVSEVIAIEPGEDGRPAVTDVYAPGPDGRARPGTMPQWLTGLSRWGFDMARFTGQGVA